jgi:hypothetical protein
MFKVYEWKSDIIWGIIRCRHLENKLKTRDECFPQPHTHEIMGWNLGWLFMGGISMVAILLDVYQICKWSFYNICKLLGIQTLLTCFQKFEIWAHVMICWCHPDSISKFEIICWHMNFDESNSIGGHLESIYVVKL